MPQHTIFFVEKGEAKIKSISSRILSYLNMPVENDFGSKLSPTLNTEEFAWLLRPVGFAHVGF